MALGVEVAAMDDGFPEFLAGGAVVAEHELLLGLHVCRGEVDVISHNGGGAVAAAAHLGLPQHVFIFVPFQRQMLACCGMPVHRRATPRGPIRGEEGHGEECGGKQQGVRFHAGRCNTLRKRRRCQKKWRCAPGYRARQGRRSLLGCLRHDRPEKSDPTQRFPTSPEMPRPFLKTSKCRGAVACQRTRSVLECSSPLELFMVRWTSESAGGPAQSKTQSARRVIFQTRPDT